MEQLKNLLFIIIFFFSGFIFASGKDEYPHEKAVALQNNFEKIIEAESNKIKEEEFTKLIKNYLEHGGNPNKTNQDETLFPLFIASKLGYLSSVRFLLEKGADILKTNSKEQSSFYAAVVMGHLAVVKFLLEKDADPMKPDGEGATPLYVASHEGFLEIVRLLLKKTGNPNQTYKAENISPLCIAILRNKQEVVEALLEHPDTDVNLFQTDGRSPLWEAADKGYLEIVEILLSKRKDIEIDKPDNIGITPYLAAQQRLINIRITEDELGKRYNDILKILEEKGADIHKRTSFILESMHRLGYEIKEKGMCYGIAHMAVQATMRGELDKFLTRMKSLASGELKEELSRILRKRKRSAPLSASSSGLGGREGPLNKKEKEELALLSFFDGIFMYAGNNYLNSFQDWRKTHEIFNMGINWSIQTVFIRKDTDKIKNIISWALKQEEVLSITLSYSGHTISLNKKTDGSLILVNHDLVTEIREDDESVEEIKRAMNHEDIFIADFISVSPLDLSSLAINFDLYSDFDEASIKNLVQDGSKILLEKAIYLSAQKGSLDIIRALIEEIKISPRIDDLRDIINSEDLNRKFTPLFVASFNGHIEIVKILLEHGADINKINTSEGGDEVTPLIAAVQCGHVEIVKILLDQGAYIDKPEVEHEFTPLVAAVQFGHVEIVKILLSSPLVDVDKRRKDGESALFFAIKAKQFSLMELLLERGAMIDFKSILVAAENGDFKIIERLLKDWDGDVNLSLEYLSGRSPLLQAAQSGHIKIVELLLAKGAKIDAVDQLGLTPLFLASAKGHIHLVQKLLENGANINLPTKNLSTPLHVAAENGHIKVVELLLENKAKVDCLDRGGATPLMVASLAGYDTLVALLLKYGAKINE